MNLVLCGNRFGIKNQSARVCKNLTEESAMCKVHAYSKFQTQRGFTPTGQLLFVCRTQKFLFKAEVLKVELGPAQAPYSSPLPPLSPSSITTTTSSILLPLNASSNFFPLPCTSKAIFSFLLFQQTRLILLPQEIVIARQTRTCNI